MQGVWRLSGQEREKNETVCAGVPLPTNEEEEEEEKKTI